MTEKGENQRGLLRTAAPRLAAAILALGLTSGASAALTNFYNQISGDVTYKGDTVGTISAKLHYNLGDTKLNLNQSLGSDKFPDKMKVTCLSGYMNNGDMCGLGSHPNAFEFWGAYPNNDYSADPHYPGGALYTPYTAYQDEYYASIDLTLTSGPYVGEFKLSSPINSIELQKDSLYSAFVIETGIGDFSIEKLGGHFLSNLYLEDALISLPDYLAIPGTSSLFKFKDTDYLGIINEIGPLTAEIPEPGGLALLAFGLAGLSLTRRKIAA